MGSIGVGGSLSAASDVNLNNPASGQSLRRVGAYWVNAALLKADIGLSSVDNTSDANKPVSTAQAAAIAASDAPTYANLPAGSTITVAKSGSTWPARPTSRNDIVVQWKGTDPSPTIVPTGTGGMLDNVDIRFVTP